MSEVKLESIFKDKKLIGMIVLSLGLMVIVFGPILTRLNDRLATNRQLKNELQKLTVKADTLVGIDDEITTERVNKMEEVFPSNKPVVQLLSSLSQLSGQNRLTFGGVTLRPGSLSESDVKSQTELAKLQFSFQVGGSFNDISSFLTALERVAPLMKIDNVALAIKSNPLFAREATIVTADISISAFYQPPPKNLGSLTAPVQLLNREDEALLNRLFSFISFGTVIPTAPVGNPDLFQVGLPVLP